MLHSRHSPIIYWIGLRKITISSVHLVSLLRFEQGTIHVIHQVVMVHHTSVFATAVFTNSYHTDVKV